MSTHTIAQADRVPLREKLAMGAGSLTAFFGFAGPERLAWPVLGMLLGLPGWLIGVCLLIPRLWDAITDPLMGRISDNASTRWGRRRPFIFAGTLLMAITFIAMWYIPTEAGDTQIARWVVQLAAWFDQDIHGNDAFIAFWFVGMQLLFFTAYTIFCVPYAALSYELTPSYHERTRVMSYLGFFHKAGEFISGWLPTMIVAASAWLLVEGTEAADTVAATSAATEGNDMTMPGVHLVAWILAIVVFVGLGMLPAFFVRERFAKPVTAGEQIRITDSIAAALSSTAFLVLVSVIIFNTLSGIIASGIDQFVLVYYMADGNQTLGLIQKGMLTSGYAIVGFASIPLITFASEYLGKKGTLYLVYWLMFIGGIAKWFVFTPGHTIINILWLDVDPVILIDPLLCGPMWVAVKILLASMMADICDEDELRHGQRREGLFGAVFSWLEKLIVSLAALSTGIVLTVSGFNAELGAEQAPETFFRMRLFLAGAPAITALFAIIALYFYPITEDRADDTRRQLEERRGQVSANH